LFPTLSIQNEISREPNPKNPFYASKIPIHYAFTQVTDHPLLSHKPKQSSQVLNGYKSKILSSYRCRNSNRTHQTIPNQICTELLDWHPNDNPVLLKNQGLQNFEISSSNRAAIYQ
jgi:hypothetical protein